MTSPPASSIPVMFDRLSRRYDFMNRVLSLGQDPRWRRRLAVRLRNRGAFRVLDLASGTGDQILALLKDRLDISAVCGLDRSRGMLSIARNKIERSGIAERTLLVEGDALSLPFPDRSMDAVTISFGIRNLAGRRMDVLREIRRVLSPGGVVLILELSVPSHPLVRPFALFYMRHVVPFLGGIITGTRAPYRYLNRSIEEFPAPEVFLREIRESGFEDATVDGMMCGVVRIWEGKGKKCGE